MVDRSVEPVEGKIVVAALNGEPPVKRLRITGKNGAKRMWLVAGDAAYPPIELLEVWAVITHVIHRCG